MSLNGKWQINDDENDFIFIGNVPGTVQGDRISQKLVPHPYIGLNEKHIQDLEDRSWTYTKEFEVKSLLMEENIELVFKGIDTLSEAIWDTEGKRIWEKKYEGIRILKNSVSTIDIVNIDEIPMKTLSDTVIYISVRCDEQEYENYFLFNDFKNIQLVDPELSYVREGDNLVFRCKRLAFGVHIAIEGKCVPSDNFFTLVPSTNKRIRYFSDKIKVKSLYNYLNKNFKKEGTS